MLRNARRITALFVLILSMAGLYTLATPNAFAESTVIAPGNATQPHTNDMHAALATALRREAREHPNQNGRHICYAAHVENIGWQQPVCDGAVAGTTGQSLRLEALDIAVSGVGGVCAAAHVQNTGWQPTTCVGDVTDVYVGTTGQSLRMEALAIRVASESVCANAHVQNVGWQGVRCAGAPNYVVVGTTGQSLRMEAVQLGV